MKGRPIADHQFDNAPRDSVSAMRNNRGSFCVIDLYIRKLGVRVCYMPKPGGGKNSPKATFPGFSSVHVESYYTDPGTYR